jgi:hypothetical protein
MVNFSKTIPVVFHKKVSLKLFRSGSVSGRFGKSDLDKKSSGPATLVKSEAVGVKGGGSRYLVSMLSLLLLALVVAAAELPPPPPLEDAPEARRRATAAKVSRRLAAELSDWWVRLGTDTEVSLRVSGRSGRWAAYTTTNITLCGLGRVDFDFFFHFQQEFP